MSTSEGDAAQPIVPGKVDTIDRALGWLLALLVAARVAYHATYLGEVPFAHATISDGAVYEQAARDIVEHPPWGTQPFYLQGSYAYLLALGMAVKAWASLGLLVQLSLAAFALWLAHRSFVRLWGLRAGRICSLLLLAHPALAFYENKYVSASLGVSCNVLVLSAFVAWLAAVRRPLARPRRVWLLAGLLGLASGLALLARPNLVLALPFSSLALLVGATHPGVATMRVGERARAAAPSLLAFALGCVLALAPMALRNVIVTGHPDLQPVHGGGTSFYIGNNPGAGGLWNDAGMLSAQLGTEQLELAARLELAADHNERDQARAIGDELYRRAFAWIREHPGDWLALELRKLWLTIGDQQLTQDYDWLGERELIPWAHRIGVPFSLLLALALLGGAALLGGRWRPTSGGLTETSASRRALAWFIAGQLAAVLLANLLYFTSAQHRLPLVLPLALLAGPGLLVGVAELEARFRPSTSRQRADRVSPLVAASAVALLVQGWVPRINRDQPHPVHYYNLAMAQDEIGEPLQALRSLDRAIALRPDHPLFRLRRAHLRFRGGDLDGAQEDLDMVLAVAREPDREPPVPAWVIEEARLEQARIDYERRLVDSRHP